MNDLFLPGIDADRIRTILAKAGGNEIESGKLASPESSAALAVNTFGWFLNRPADLPPLPGLDDLDWPAERVDVERCLRFPWSGGRHPWLDAVVETRDHLVGVESKRFEPFRDVKTVSMSQAYDRPVWGGAMRPYEDMRDALRAGLCYRHLDAVQLVKHAFGIVTQSTKCGKRPVLYYIFAEPHERAGLRISEADLARHRAEITEFQDRTEGAAVRFASTSYREYLARWSGPVAEHARNVLGTFSP